MKPKPPRKIFVMITDEMRPLAEYFLRKMATITAIVPPAIHGYPYRFELENRDWPSGEFNQAALLFNEGTENGAATMKVELVMV